MLDPWHLLKSIKKRLQCDEKTKKEKLAQIMELMVERNVDDYRRDLQRLAEDPITAAVIADLLERKERIFYCEVEDSFIGIRRTNCEKINDLIKQRVPVELKFEDFVSEINELDARLNERSLNEFELMKEPL